MLDLKCKKIKEMRSGKETKMVFVALLQFKWVLFGVCIRREDAEKRATVHIIAKADAQWLAEVAMHCAKFAILADARFVGGALLNQ